MLHCIRLLHLLFSHTDIRLNTIMDSDYILVMSDGVASEFDSPKKLLEKGGLFRELVRSAARD